MCNKRSPRERGGLATCNQGSPREHGEELELGPGVRPGSTEDLQLATRVVPGSSIGGLIKSCVRCEGRAHSGAHAGPDAFGRRPHSPDLRAVARPR